MERKSKKSFYQRWWSPRNIGRLFLSLLLLFYFLWGWAALSGPPLRQIALSEALGKIRQGEVEEIVVIDSRIELKLSSGERVFTEKEPGVGFVEILTDAQIDPTQLNLRVNNQNWAKMAADLLATFLPLAFTAFLFWYIFKQAGRAQTSLFSFGKSKAKLFVKGKQSVTFKNVAGLAEAKEELREIVDFLKHPEKYRRMGARTPKGVLLVGPSGVGKTLLARAVAGEANVPFFSMAGSEFMEILVGVGASRVRDLFANAKKAAPSIIFIDELDAIGRVRGLGVVAGHDEREQTLNQILVEMDGFEPNEKVIVIAATNRGDLLDPALLRPGRFDRRINLTLPDLQEREAILKLHAVGKPIASSVSWRKVARRTVGFSGADLENMLNEAAILAAREGKTEIGQEEIEEAAIKVKLGPEKKRFQSKQDRQLTAYHEAGHALLSFLVPQMDPVSRVSIVSRGLSLGYTLIPPRREYLHETKTRLLSQITTLLGGRVAEELKFQEMTTGAAVDIQQATAIARQMVVKYGMSRLGPLNWGPQLEISDYTRPLFGPESISPQMKGEVDRAVKEIVDKCYRKATILLKRRRKVLDKLAQLLVKKETLSGQEVKKLLNSKNG